MLKLFGFVLVFSGVFNYVFADDGDIVITCPAIKDCRPSDGPKQNMSFSRINQAAYECFRAHGETALASQAVKAQTKCLTIYGSTTATIDGKAVSDGNSTKSK